MKTKDIIPKKDKDFLISQGWIQDKTAWNHWYDPELTPEKQGGGTSTKFALEKATNRYRKKAGLPVYIVRAVTAGGRFGYKVLRFVENQEIGTGVFFGEKSDDCDKAIKAFNNGKSYTYQGITYNGTDEAINSLKYNFALILEEKYGNWYYHITSFDSFQRTVLSIVQRRIKEGYWYTSSVSQKDIPKKPFEKELIDQMPTESLKEEARKQYKRYEEEIKYHTELLHEIELVKKAKKGDTVAAIELFRNREDSQYEGYELEKLTVV